MMRFEITVVTRYTGMEKNCLDTSSGTLFVISLSPDVHVTSDVITYHCSA